jgi:hypothetical protein
MGAAVIPTEPPIPCKVDHGSIRLLHCGGGHGAIHGAAE